MFYISEGVWKVKTITGSEENSSATCGVNVELIGLKGVSGKLSLAPAAAEEETQPSEEKETQSSKEKEKEPSEEKDILKEGQEDEFEIKVEEDIGDVFKVRICLDKQLETESWNVTQVEIDFHIQILYIPYCHYKL